MRTGNGRETCDPRTCRCLPGSPPCTTYEGCTAPCDEATDSCPTDDDLDGVPDECDVCPGSDDNVPGARDDDDGDGVLNCNDKCNGVDDAVFAPECEGAIPTTSQWGLIVLSLLLLAGGKIYFAGRWLSANERRS